MFFYRELRYQKSISFLVYTGVSHTYPQVQSLRFSHLCTHTQSKTTKKDITILGYFLLVIVAF